MAKDQEKDSRNWLEAYALLCYKHPFKIFFSLSVLLVALSAISLLTTSISDGEGEEWTIKGHIQTDRDKAIEFALEDLGSGDDQPKQPQRSEDSDDVNLIFLFQAKDGGKNVFTEDNMKTIKEIEEVVLAHPEYKNFCQLNYENEASDPTCQPPLSPVSLFYEYDVENHMYGERRQSIDEGLDEILSDFFINSFFVDDNFEATKKSEYTRSKINLGMPVNGQNNSLINDDDQVDFIKDGFLEDVEKKLFDKLGMKKGFLRTEYTKNGKLNDVEVVFFSSALESLEGERIIWLDFVWAFASIIFVFLYMLIHLGSVFLAIVGIFEVFMAFPVALFFYSLVFQIEFFNEMNFLVVFILLGIGADDVFVFTDAFKQSPAVPGIGHSLQARLMYSTRRASKAIFVTSFTTMAAFFATATSSLMPMQAFGIFAALCIIFLFLINVALMPPALVMWSGYTHCCVNNVCVCFPMLHRTQCCASAKKCMPCLTCCHEQQDETFNLPIALPANGTPPLVPVQHAISAPNTDAKGVEMTRVSQAQGEGSSDSSEDQRPPKAKTDVEGEDESKLRGLERFYGGPFFKFLQMARYFLIAGGIISLAVGIGLSTTFTAPNEAEIFYPKGHMFYKFFDLVDREGPFVSNKEDTTATVHLAWGLKGMDTSKISHWDGKDFGDLEYDEGFDMTTKAAQEHMLGVCTKARSGKCRVNAVDCKRDEAEDEAGFLVLLDRDGKTDEELKDQAPCWIEAMDDWLRAEKNTSLPVRRNEFVGLLTEFSQTESAKIVYSEHIGLIAGELKFVQFEFTSTYFPPSSYDDTKGVVDSWQDFIDELNELAVANGAESVSNGFQSGREFWTWIFTQRALLRNAVQGLVIVFAIAFVVLNFATGNIIISIIAIITVAGIVATEMGIAIRGIVGWKLGIAESITTVILIGFSMDYSLHLADAYVSSEHKDRLSRTRDALRHLGISVTAGAITSIGSGLFLWGAIMTFFTKFAFNMTTTILISFLYSMLFFPAMCMTVGPQGDFGRWRYIVGYFCSCCLPKKSEEK